MFVRKLPYIIYRAYPTSGYLTDNRNFGYDTATKSCIKVGRPLRAGDASAENTVRRKKVEKIILLGLMVKCLF